jgi:cyclophilin family peptidyl-prolyl cis-trans isomerase
MASVRVFREPPLTISAAPLRCTLETDVGSLELELDPRSARRAVNNFAYLIREGFYDGLGFHRIVPGFIAQAGCPRGMGDGDAGFRFTGEIPRDHHYRRGDVALASSGPRNGNGSQFFICLADLPELQSVYPLLGRVVDGDAVIDRLDAIPADDDGRPHQAVRVQGIGVIS